MIRVCHLVLEDICSLPSSSNWDSNNLLPDVSISGGTRNHKLGPTKVERDELVPACPCIQGHVHIGRDSPVIGECQIRDSEINGRPVVGNGRVGQVSAPIELDHRVGGS